METFFWDKGTFCVPVGKPFGNYKTCLEMGFSGENTTQHQQCWILHVLLLSSLGSLVLVSLELGLILVPLVLEFPGKVLWADMSCHQC